MIDWEHLIELVIMAALTISALWIVAHVIYSCR